MRDPNCSDEVSLVLYAVVILLIALVLIVGLTAIRTGEQLDTIAALHDHTEEIERSQETLLDIQGRLERIEKATTWWQREE